ncbi:MAG TPA: hypothetical protein VEQ63_03520, partial [Bryobacteraceae bacterium]|nr:hypothetical protein [Bryobacteraceae bacterium]
MVAIFKDWRIHVTGSGGSCLLVLAFALTTAFAIKGIITALDRNTGEVIKERSRWDHVRRLIGLARRLPG